MTGRFEGYTVERKGFGFVLVGTGSKRWASLYASPRKCGIPTLEGQNPLFLAALRNFELSDWSMDGCGVEQIGIPDFGELAPVLRRVGEFLAENELGERVSVEVAVDCLVQLNSPPNSALEESVGCSALTAEVVIGAPAIAASRRAGRSIRNPPPKREPLFTSCDLVLTGLQATTIGFKGASAGR